MAYDPGAIDAALVAAVGDEPGLVAELRLAFVDSATCALSAMDKANSVEEWQGAASRIRGLAASFGAVRLMALAAEAADTQPGDLAMLSRLRRAVTRL